MGILKSIRMGWSKISTKEKIDIILDVVTGIGSGIGSVALGNLLGSGHGRFSRACVMTTSVGLGLAAQKVSSDALKQNYGDPLAKAIDKAKAQSAKAKEEVAYE